MRNNPATGEYTHLSYNCTFADDQFVNLDDSLFAVEKISCAENKMFVSTTTPEGMEELIHALMHPLVWRPVGMPKRPWVSIWPHHKLQVKLNRVSHLNTTAKVVHICKILSKIMSVTSVSHRRSESV